METIARIRRELHVSRKVVHKVLRSEATEFHYEREQQPMPRLGAWRDELDKLLVANEARPSRERLTLIRVFEALRVSGCEGGYDAVRRYARTWQRDQVSASALAYVLLSFAPGEAYQFDWSYEILTTMAELKLYGMKAAYDEIIGTAVKRQHEPSRARPTGMLQAPIFHRAAIGRRAKGAIRCR